MRNISCNFSSIPNVTRMGRVYEMLLRKLNTLMFLPPKIIRKRKRVLISTMIKLMLLKNRKNKILSYFILFYSSSGFSMGKVTMTTLLDF